MPTYELQTGLKSQILPLDKYIPSEWGLDEQKNKSPASSIYSCMKLTIWEPQQKCTHLCLMLWFSPLCSSSSFSVLSMASLHARLDFLHAVWLLQSTEEITTLKTVVSVVYLFVSARLFNPINPNGLLSFISISNVLLAPNMDAFYFQDKVLMDWLCK